MNNTEALKKLWEDGFFKEGKTSQEISKELNEKFGKNLTNISDTLNKSSKQKNNFLLKKKKNKSSLWIQKINYDLKNKDNKDNILFLNIFKDSNKSKQLYLNKHYPESIFNFCKMIEEKIKKKSENEDIGKLLMSNAFNEKSPQIKFNKCKKKNEISEQEGFKFIFMGIFLIFRNEGGHKEYSKFFENNKENTDKFIGFLDFLNNEINKSIL